MPVLNTKRLKTSSLQGFLLFLYPSAITIYYYLFCYTVIQIADIQKSTLPKIQRLKKHPHFTGNFKKVVVKIINALKSCLQKLVSTQKRSKSTLQKRAYSKKQSKSGKSTQKQFNYY